jgi:hypothetical protein
MNIKKHTVMYSIGLSGIALALAFMISLNINNNNSAIAQQSSTTTTPTMSTSFSSQNQNWTGSISLFSPIIDAFKSKVHTTLNDATTNAIKAVGGGTNSSAVAAFIHPERGFLVYNVLVLDSSSKYCKSITERNNIATNCGQNILYLNISLR